MDYRLLPEHTTEQAINDCVAAYRFVLETLKVAPEQLAVLGDSSGGYLALMMLLRARDAGTPVSVWISQGSLTRTGHEMGRHGHAGWFGSHLARYGMLLTTVEQVLFRSEAKRTV